MKFLNFGIRHALLWGLMLSWVLLGVGFAKNVAIFLVCVYLLVALVGFVIILAGLVSGEVKVPDEFPKLPGLVKFSVGLDFALALILAGMGHFIVATFWMIFIVMYFVLIALTYKPKEIATT